MKKFFINGTNDQLVFGDTLELDLTHEGDGNTVKQHVSCKFVPEIADLLLESGVIEEREVEEEEQLTEDDCFTCYQELCEQVDAIHDLQQLILNKLDNTLTAVMALKIDVKSLMPKKAVKK